jgi:hypothetical protein
MPEVGQPFWVVRFYQYIWGCIHNISISFVTMNGPFKLDCYTTLGWKGLPETNALDMNYNLEDKGYGLVASG